MREPSEFIRGMVNALEIAETIGEDCGESVADELRSALVLMVNGYYERLVRMGNRIDSEMDVLEHTKKYMPRVQFPGDLRAEGEVIE